MRMTGAMQPCFEFTQMSSDESTAVAKIAQRDIILDDACQGRAGPKSAYADFYDAKDSRLMLRLVLPATSETRLHGSMDVTQPCVPHTPCLYPCTPLYLLVAKVLVSAHKLGIDGPANGRAEVSISSLNR